MTKLFVLSLLAGCYQAYGVAEVKAPPPPTLVDGATVDVDDRVYKEDAFHFNRAGDLVQNKYRMAKATYNGEDLSLPRLAALANPERWDQQVKQAQDMYATCRRGVVPEIVAGVAMFAATILVIGLASEHGDSGSNYTSNEKLVLGGIAGGFVIGGGSYIYGYARGGKECEKLKAFRREISVDEKDDAVKQLSEDDIQMVNKLAAEFNARRGAAPSEPAPDPEASTN